MVIRTGYHDAMSIDPACLKNNPIGTKGAIKCGGAGALQSSVTQSYTVPLA